MLGKSKALICGINTANWFSAISFALRHSGFAEVHVAANSRLNDQLFDTTSLHLLDSSALHKPNQKLGINLDENGFPYVANPEDHLRLDQISQYSWIWVISGISLLPGLIDIPVIKRLGVKVGFIWCGSEIRYSPGSVDILLQNEIIPSERFIEDLAKDSNVSLISFINNNVYQQTLFKKLYQLRISEAYADILINHPEQNSLGIRPYFSSLMFHNVNVAFQRPHGKRRIYARSTNPSAKGLNRFEQEVMSIDPIYKEFHHSPVPETLFFQEITSAGIYFDQLAYPAGSAINCCALGRVALAGNSFPGTWSFADWPFPRLTANNMLDVSERLLSMNEVEFEELCYFGYQYSNNFTLSSFVVKLAEIIEGGAHPEIQPTWFDEHFVLRYNLNKVPDWLQTFNAYVATQHGSGFFLRAIALQLLPRSHKTEYRGQDILPYSREYGFNVLKSQVPLRSANA